MNTSVYIIAILVLGVLLWYIYRKPSNFKRHWKHVSLKLFSTNYKGKLLGEINKVRRIHHLAPLGRMSFLDRVAKTHSIYQARHNSCNHDGFKKRSDYIRIKTGLSFVGENCFKYPANGYNHRVARALVKGWMSSPGHRKNILGNSYHKTGIGIISKHGYIYATQIFTE